MFNRRGWIVAALTGAFLTFPVALALAARSLPSPPRAIGLRASLAGHSTVSRQMHDVVRDDLLARHARLQRRVARLSGDRVPAQALSRAQSLTAAQLQVANRRLQGRARELDVPIDPVLHRIAQCESHGDPRAVGGGGQYRGAFQMSMSTWASLGGMGDPVDASLAEQYRRAATLLARSGPGQWPACA